MDIQEDKFKFGPQFLIWVGDEVWARIPVISESEGDIGKTIETCLNTDLTFPMKVRSFGLNVSIKVLLGVYVPVLVANSNEKAKELAELLTIK